MKRAVFIGLLASAALGLTGAASYVALYTDLGTRTALRTVSALLPGFSVRGSKGTLASGNVTLDGLYLRAGPVTIRAREASLLFDPSPGTILSRVLHVEKLSAEGLTVTLEMKPRDPAAPAPVYPPSAYERRDTSAPGFYYDLRKIAGLDRLYLDRLECHDCAFESPVVTVYSADITGEYGEWSGGKVKAGRISTDRTAVTSFLKPGTPDGAAAAGAASATSTSSTSADSEAPLSLETFPADREEFFNGTFPGLSRHFRDSYIRLRIDVGEISAKRACYRLRRAERKNGDPVVRDCLSPVYEEGDVFRTGEASARLSGFLDGHTISVSHAEAHVPAVGDAKVKGKVTLGGYIGLDFDADAVFRYRKDGFFPEYLSVLDGSSFRIRTGGDLSSLSFLLTDLRGAGITGSLRFRMAAMYPGWHFFALESTGIKGRNKDEIGKLSAYASLGPKEAEMIVPAASARVSDTSAYIPKDFFYAKSLALDAEGFRLWKSHWLRMRQKFSIQAKSLAAGGVSMKDPLLRSTGAPVDISVRLTDASGKPLLSSISTAGNLSLSASRLEARAAGLSAERLSAVLSGTDPLPHKRPAGPRPKPNGPSTGVRFFAHGSYEFTASSLRAMNVTLSGVRARNDSDGKKHTLDVSVKSSPWVTDFSFRGTGELDLRNHLFTVKGAKTGASYSAGRISVKDFAWKTDFTGEPVSECSGVILMDEVTRNAWRLNRNMEFTGSSRGNFAFRYQKGQGSLKVNASSDDLGMLFAGFRLFRNSKADIGADFAFKAGKAPSAAFRAKLSDSGGMKFSADFKSPRFVPATSLSDSFSGRLTFSNVRILEGMDWLDEYLTVKDARIKGDVTVSGTPESPLLSGTIAAEGVALTPKENVERIERGTVSGVFGKDGHSLSAKAVFRMKSPGGGGNRDSSAALTLGWGGMLPLRSEKFGKIAELVTGTLSAEVNDVIVKYRQPGISAGKYAWEASGELDPVKIRGTLSKGLFDVGIDVPVKTGNITVTTEELAPAGGEREPESSAGKSIRESLRVRIAVRLLHPVSARVTDSILASMVGQASLTGKIALLWTERGLSCETGERIAVKAGIGISPGDVVCERKENGRNELAFDGSIVGIPGTFVVGLVSSIYNAMFGQWVDMATAAR